MAGLGEWLKAKLTPRSLEDIERETRQWVIECRTCGRSRNLWEAGGKRFKAHGTKTVLGRCAGCADRLRAMKIHKPAPRRHAN